MPTIDAAWRLAADVTEVASEEDLVDILREVCARMGCSWFALSHHIDFLAAPEKGVRVHNYPEDWAHWFDQERLGVSDPVHRASERRMAGFLWRDAAEFNSPCPHDAMIIERAQRHGIYEGLTIPAHLAGEAHGSISFAWPRGGPVRPEALPFAQSFGAFAFEAARRLAGPVPEDGRPKLTDRQIECMIWAARGKSSWMIAGILDVSEDTVREHFRIARAKYDAPSRTSLIIRALFDGAISFCDIARD